MLLVIFKCCLPFLSVACHFEVLLSCLKLFVAESLKRIKNKLFKSIFIKKHTSPCSSAVEHLVTNREVAGSNPAVDVDRCGFSPNGLEGVLCLLNFLASALLSFKFFLLEKK